MQTATALGRPILKARDISFTDAVQLLEIQDSTVILELARQVGGRWLIRADINRVRLMGQSIAQLQESGSLSQQEVLQLLFNIESMGKPVREIAYRQPLGALAKRYQVLIDASLPDASLRKTLLSWLHKQSHIEINGAWALVPAFAEALSRKETHEAARAYQKMINSIPIESDEDSDSDN